MTTMGMEIKNKATPLMLIQGVVVYNMLQLSLTGGSDKQASMTSQQQLCDLGGEGSQSNEGKLGRPTAPHQGDKVGVADLGALSHFPEMSDATAGDT